MHLQWLRTKASVALIDVNPVSGTYHVLAHTTTREQMVENAAFWKNFIAKYAESLYMQEPNPRGPTIFDVLNCEFHKWPYPRRGFVDDDL